MKEITNKRPFKEFPWDLAIPLMQYNLTLWSASLKPAERNGKGGWPFALYSLKGQCPWRIWDSLLVTSDLMYHLYHKNFLPAPGMCMSPNDSSSAAHTHWTYTRWTFTLHSFSKNFGNLTFWVNVKIYLAISSLRFQTVPSTITCV